MYNNLNITEFKCTFYGIANWLLSYYTITSNGKDIYIYVLNVILNVMHQHM